MEMTKENLHAVRQIRTFAGKYVNVFEPDPSTIVIEDIAHALSQMPRFGGHLPEFFSVAQHSLMCCNAAPNHLKFQALMHNTSEAYLLDVPRPIKRELSNYKMIEDRLMLVIAEKFGFDYPLNQIVKDIDNLQLQREWDVLMVKDKATQFADIRCMSSLEAESQFLFAYNYWKNYGDQNI